MASYITLTLDDLRPLLAPFAVGELLSIQPIPQGTTNSIFRLTTSLGRFALVCHEARVSEASIPFFLGLMRHLAAAGIPCPAPLFIKPCGALHIRCAPCCTGCSPTGSVRVCGGRGEGG